MLGKHSFIFIEKLSPLPGFKTWDLPGTKPICYQLSYPGLDKMLEYSISIGIIMVEQTYWKCLAAPKKRLNLNESNNHEAD